MFGAGKFTNWCEGERTATPIARKHGGTASVQLETWIAKLGGGKRSGEGHEKNVKGCFLATSRGEKTGLGNLNQRATVTRVTEANREPKGY